MFPLHGAYIRGNTMRGEAMEREPICYISEGERKIDSIRNLIGFCRKPLPCKNLSFAGQKLVHVQIPMFDEKFDSRIRGFYIKRVRSKMWNVLLSNQNASIYPAFCSEGIYHRFHGIDSLAHELWITAKLPPFLVELSLYLFLRKDCFFSKDTKVFVADNRDVAVERLLYPYYSRLNYLQFLVEDKDRYDDFADEMFEESGLALAVTTKPENAREADVIIDLGDSFLIDAKDLKKGCIYFDGFADGGKEKSIRNCRNDVTYISSRNYLDRALKSTL